MKHFKKTFIALSMVSIVGLSTAAVTPVQESTDGRIRVVAYQPDNIINIQGSTFVNTQVVFGSDESIVSVQSGDTAAWIAKVDNGLPNILDLKPTIVGSNTNMTIVTTDDAGEKRLYYFHVTSIPGTPDNHTQATYALRFVYPDKERQQLQNKQQQNNAILNAAQNPAAYNWDYSFSGDKTIVPLHVYDDGKFTYLELRPGQTIPAVFAVAKENGKESVVNYRRNGQFIVIQQLSPQFTLRNGADSVASIFNNTDITKLINNNSGN